MDIKDKISVMKAFDEGKTIEVRGASILTWMKSSDPCWDWRCYEYRVKPDEVQGTKWLWVMTFKDDPSFTPTLSCLYFATEEEIRAMYGKSRNYEKALWSAHTFTVKGK